MADIQEFSLDQQTSEMDGVNAGSFQQATQPSRTIALKISPDGKLQLPKNLAKREELKRLLADSEITSQAPAVSKRQSEEAAEQLVPLVKQVVQALGRLEAIILSNKSGLDEDKVTAIVGPNKPIDELISTSASRVLVKYNMMSKWGDEIALIALIATWQAGVFQSLKMLKASEDKKREQKAEE